MDKDMVVIPLGTVSTYCFLDKCCPGYLVKYGDNKILLDCGNGVSKHMNLPEDLNNLIIVISHLHSDHYGELLSLAQTSMVFNRLGYIDNKIKVYIPYNNSLIDYHYLLNLEENSYMEFIPYTVNDIFYFESLKISFSLNPHQVISHSIKIESEDIKLVYSGDTGYKNNTLEKFSRDANLLICESTFLKGQKRLEDYHLFASEAGKIALNANVGKLLLTHFWPSIDKECYVDEAKRYFKNTEASIEGEKLVLRRIENV